MKRLSRGNRSIIDLSLVLACGAVFVALVWKLALTRGPLLPGLDGAYYWVQVRSLLERSRMAFDDVPIVFLLQAAVAKVLGDVPLAVRLSDAFLPVFSAIPIYFMTRNSKYRFAPAVAVLVVLLHPVQLYFFTGDFIKNEAAIPLVFFIGYLLMTWDAAKNKKFLLSMVAVSIGILSVTHFGTFLLALLIVGAWSFAQLLRKENRKFALSLSSSLALVFVCIALLGVLVPSRFNRLRDFIFSPVEAFSVPIWNLLVRGDTPSVMVATFVIGQVGALFLGVIVWKNRQALTYSHRSLVVVNLIIAFVLSSPAIGIEWSYRLAALSFVPLSIAGLVLIATLQSLGACRLIAVASLLVIVTSVSLIPGGAKPPVLEDALYDDFHSLMAEVNLPDNSVVVAEHGLEFLVAWELRTDVVPDLLLQESDLTGYSNVYLLIQKETDSATPDSTPPKIPENDKPTAPNGGAKQENYSGTAVFENDSFILVRTSM